jgi:hypothetical protein
LLRYRFQTPQSSLDLDLKAPLSSVYLRPDFEEEYRDTFMTAIDSYHRYYYRHTHLAIRSYLDQLTPNQTLAATSSFMVLEQMAQINKPCVFSGPTAKDRSDSQHIEYLIARVAECSREWASQTSPDNPTRKQELEDFLLFGLSEICHWVPMPPVEGAILTDIKVCCHLIHKIPRLVLLTTLE